MNELTLKPDPEAVYSGDKRIAVPMLPAAAARRRGEGRARRRFSATHLAQPADAGFRPFRVY